MNELMALIKKQYPKGFITKGEPYPYQTEIDPKTGTFLKKKKRKLTAWNKFVKANANKKRFQYANGKLKLKKMGIAYRKRR